MRLFCVLCSTLAIIAGSSGAALASGIPSNQHGTVWSQRDTAIYVVSTLNLMRTSGGRPLPAVLAGRWHVDRFVVSADQKVRDLYFITLRRSNGRDCGALAYEMGWLKPKGVTAFPARMGIARAPRALIEAYRDDPLDQIGTFTSTMPQ